MARARVTYVEAPDPARAVCALLRNRRLTGRTAQPQHPLSLATVCPELLTGGRDAPLTVGEDLGGALVIHGDGPCPLPVRPRQDDGRRRSAVIVLGHASEGTRSAPVLSTTAQKRLRCAEAVAESCADTLVLMSGRGKAEVRTSEAELMAASWRGRPVPMLQERAATNTAENAVFSRPLIDAIGRVDEVLVVTSAWHVPRAWLLLRLVGIRPRMVAAPCELREWRMAALEVRYLLHVRRNLRAARVRLREVP